MKFFGGKKKYEYDVTIRDSKKDELLYFDNVTQRQLANTFVMSRITTFCFVTNCDPIVRVRIG